MSQIFQIEEKNTGKFFTAIIYNSKNENNTAEMQQRLSSEIEIISKLSHPSIINFHGLSQIDFNQKNHPVFIFEYESNLTLKKIIQDDRSNKLQKNWNMTKKIINIFGIASAISYLHKQKKFNLCLNLENIFETSQFYPKLIYFNFFNFNKNDQPIETKVFIAPEILAEKEITSSSDVYSFAMIVYSILTGKIPFENELNQVDLCDKIINGYRPTICTKIPEIYQELIELCWSQDTTARPTIEEIIEKLKIINEKDVDRTEFETYINKIENDEQKFLLKNYEKVELIGAGSFSNVYKIRDKETGEIFAAKIMNDKSEMNENESMILSQLNHPSIIKFIGSSPIDFELKQKQVIVTEYLSNRSLEDILEIERSGLSIPFWNDTFKLINIYGIASAMSYLHSKNILHRDLKPGNVLIDDFLFPKLSDFGFSTFISSKNKQIKAGTIGTASFIAPEILKENKYSKSSDVYAFGVLVYEIMEKTFPFDGIQNIVIEYKVSVEERRPEFKTQIPDIYKNLITSCWNQEPNKRPSFDDITDELKNNKDFISEKIDENLYLSYIDFIKENMEKKICDNSENEKFSKYSLSAIYEEYENMMMSSF